MAHASTPGATATSGTSLLEVSAGDDEPETLEIDPDRATVLAVGPGAVAELARMLDADLVTEQDTPDDSAGAHAWELTSGGVWANLRGVEWPDGIVSIHPVPLRHPELASAFDRYLAEVVERGHLGVAYDVRELESAARLR